MPVTVGPLRVSGVPSLDSCASTVSSERSDATITELNTKVQVKVTPVPTVTMSELPLLVSIREEGVGTIQTQIYNNINSDQYFNTHFEFSHFEN